MKRRQMWMTARLLAVGMVASLMTFPEHGIVVALISNISYADTESVALKIAQAFAEQRRGASK